MADETLEQQLAALKAKVDDFRSNNVALMQERDALKAKYGDIDPVAAKAAIEKLAAGGDGETVTALKLELAKSKSDALAAQAAATQAAFATTIGTEALRVGALPEAVETLVAKAAKIFSMKDGALQTDAFGTPGNKLTVTEWLQSQFKEAAFCFKPSTGGGASKGGGATTGVKTIVNPTPQQLGENATAIKRGTLKVSYE